MSPHQINTQRCIALIIVLLSLVSCSSKIITTGTKDQYAGKKISFKTTVHCIENGNTDIRNDKRYTGSSKINTILGEIELRFDFYGGGRWINNTQGTAFSNNSFRSPPGNTYDDFNSFHSTISLNKKDVVFLEYSQLATDTNATVITLEARVRGGKGIFKNASGSIVTEVHIGLRNRMALSYHQGTIYLNDSL